MDPFQKKKKKKMFNFYLLTLMLSSYIALLLVKCKAVNRVHPIKFSVSQSLMNLAQKELKSLGKELPHFRIRKTLILSH